MPTGIWLTLPLESRYARPDWPANVDGVLVLGGGLGSEIIESRGAPASASSEARVVGAFELARRYPNARVVFSGGSGELGGSKYTDADGAKYIFAQLGMDPSRLILENRSRNTGENIAYSLKIAKPHPGEVWLLATSALHMPRAMHIAKRAHWKMIAWPTDYWTTPGEFGNLFAVPENLEAMDRAVHEWIGLLAYR